jgi:hypothetical protein
VTATAAPLRSTLDPTAAPVWRAARGPVAMFLLVLLAGVALAAVAGGRPTGLLDPRAADRSGSRAVASLLRDQGVTVELVRTSSAMQSAAHVGDTLLVTTPDLLVDSQVAAVQSTGADVVLAAPHDPERFLGGVTLRGPTDTGNRPPGCALEAAVRAGTADAGGLAYAVDSARIGAGSVSEVEECYSSDGDPSLVHAQLPDGHAVTVLGNPSGLTNDRLAKQGNAALALGLLGVRDRLVWYLPTPGDVPASEQRTIYDLMPDGVWWAVVQVSVAVLLFGLWRARRLGPIVAEPLPVVVRATETVEGRGRLYRRSSARDKASAALRSATLGRLVPALGMPRRSPPAAVVDAVAARSGWPTLAVSELLYGAAPADDSELVRLEDQLDDLEKEVRRP